MLDRLPTAAFDVPTLEASDFLLRNVIFLILCEKALPKAGGDFPKAQPNPASGFFVLKEGVLGNSGGIFLLPSWR